MSLEQLIAGAGAKYYDNIRKGFGIERPDEARARTLEELQIEGAKTDIDAARQNMEAKRRELEEWDKRAATRDAQDKAALSKAEREASPEYQEQQKKLNELTVEQAEKSLQKTIQDITIAKSQQERITKAQTTLDYNTLLIGLNSFDSTAEQIQYLKDNKQELLRLGNPEQDQLLEKLFKAPEGQQSMVLKSIMAGNAIAQKYNHELNKIIAKEKAKGGGYKSTRGKLAADLRLAIQNGDTFAQSQIVDELKKQGAATNLKQLEADIKLETQIGHRVSDHFNITAMDEADQPLVQGISGYRDVEDFVKERQSKVGLSQAIKDIEQNFDIEYDGDIPTSFTRLMRVKSIEEARALPSGTRFVDPKGVKRVAP